MAKEKIGLRDIVQLALNGYKPGDIKELITLAEEAGNVQTAEEPPAGSEPSSPAGDPARTQEPEKEQEPEKTTETIDYKKLYEQAAGELKAAQAANRAQSAQQPDPEKDWKNLQDAIRSYM